MAAGQHDFTIEQGATFRRRLTVTVGDPAVAMDLTGYTARMQIRETPTSPDPAVVSLTTENGGITLGGTAGTIDLVISDTSSDAIAITNGVYDLELAAADGDVTRLLKGSIVIDQEVTR